MNTIIFPLRPGMQGGAVADLQDALLLLIEKRLIQLPPPLLTHVAPDLTGMVRQERTAQIYKDGTAAVVKLFREQFHLTAGEDVDQPTAGALNAALKQAGAFADTAAQQQWAVAGQARREDGVALQGLRVRAEHQAAGGPVRLGESDSDTEGRYTIRYEPLPGVDGIDLRVTVFDTDGKPLHVSDVVRGAKPFEIVDLTVPGADIKLHRVEGRVTSRVSAGIGGLRVLIVDKGVGGDLQLAETTTNEVGAYRVTLSDSAARQRGKLQADLQVRVFAGDGMLGASDVRYNASQRETLNVLLEDSATSALRSEHEVLTAALGSQFSGKLADLKETDGQQDITYLANKTGWDARAVALATLADQYSTRATSPAGGAGIHPALFYALFRAGLPANDAALYRANADTVAAIWKQGIAQGVVPAHLEADIPAALDQFKTLSARQMLSGPAVSGLSSLSEVLAVSLPNADTAQREQFVGLQIQHQGEPAKFWDAVQTTFGEPAAKRLRLDGQLGFLTLNNAPLTVKLHAAAAQDAPLTDPVNLVERGFYRPDKWLALLGNDPTPPEIGGADQQEKLANYADVLATQLRLSYPTATVAAMVKSGETPTANGTADRLHDFLMQHHDHFEIGMQPVEQYVARNRIQLEPEVQHEITRIQRVHQITPNDAAMNALLTQGVDSAYAAARYSRGEFVGAFKDVVGGEVNAALIHAKAQQVHNAMLNIATSYLLASNAPGIGVHSPAQIVNPAPDVPANTGDVIAYPTLEKLFGAMDYCDCEQCRSVLSPAAYLVNLLQFLDRDQLQWNQILSQWKKDHGNAPYPFGDQAAWSDAGQPAGSEIAPLAVLLSRRPDLQHLPLTCENTNTALPYIDLVNETLEYFVANGLNLKDYTGHSTDDSATSEELMANPQFVQDAAYEILAGRGNPSPLLAPTESLPFHQPLESLRRTFDVFAAPLPRVMETLRTSGAIERTSVDGYGWRDIWMEELDLSRAEYARLSDRTLTLKQLYGFTEATADADVMAAVSNAKAFTRRLDISYEELIEVLRTRFINPNGGLIPKLERLGVSVDKLKAFKEGAVTDQQFAEALAPHLDPAQYGGDIGGWVKNPANFAKIMGLLVLADPTGAGNPASFDNFEFRYADPSRLAERVRPFEFIRLLRFIRLWKKLGWTIEQTDKAITALYPTDQVPDGSDDNADLQKLDTGFLTLLPRLGVLKRVIDSLDLNPKTDLLPMLACFAPIDTYGAAALYRRLFLNPALLRQDAKLADDGYGNFLDGSEKLLKHEQVVRAAFTLAGDEFQRICDALGFDADTPLTVENISAVFRRIWLARKLKLSVQEFLLLARFSGLDPFAAIDAANPAMLLFVKLVNRLRAIGLKPSQALYLIWNQDISGKSAPDAGQINEFARSLRAGFAAVESEFVIVEDSDGQIARARMALVYDGAATDLFFGLLNDTLVSDVQYGHGQAALEPSIRAAALDRMAYDDFRKRLSFSGVMTKSVYDALNAVPGVTAKFTAAVKGLYEENQKVVAPFFARYPELQPLYDVYVASTDPAEKKRSDLLAKFLPELKRRRKRQQALQAVSAAAKANADVAGALLGVAAVLHAATDAARPALDDLTGIEQPGLAAQFFLRDTASGVVDKARDAEARLDYRAPGSSRAADDLPANGGNPISGIWRGYLEAPESAFYNLRIEVDAGANVALIVGDAGVALTQNGNVWSNTTPLELRAGTLYAFNLTVERVKDAISVQWQTIGRGWEVIPARYFYSATLRDYLGQAYLRFFKAVSLASGLRLTANEIAYLASLADHQIDGQGWLNRLPVAGSPEQTTSQALCRALGAILDLAELKAALAPDDERLLAVLRVPQTAAPLPESPIFALTRWEPGALAILLARFGKSNADLARLDVFRQVFDAYGWITTLGIPAAALIAVTTNEPTATTVRDLQGALRARYAESDWLNVIKLINDELRGLQRDALVDYVLHQMRANPASAHIDTADKLFEYFLMDVQMESCMQTSRIRHALSSVQLFIERCLMNLEQRVSSSVIKADEWGVMRLYRLWEANRKVFLWPENWLEPELRDDQSPFFKEAMSELLQGDITEDRAEVALLNYLAKLDEVAKLEPCGMHYVENDVGNADDVAHVVARTAGASRKYFYRRCEFGSWTPWEQIKLDIEDNPVIPVIWKSRLLVFWLRILKQVSSDGRAPITADPDGPLTGVHVSQVNVEPPNVTVQALLCWSEYYNGKWQPTKTSDVNGPVTLGQFGAADFDRAALWLAASEEDNALRIGIGAEGGPSFLLYNTHSLPIASNGGKLGYSFERSRLVESGNPLTVYYDLGDGHMDVTGYSSGTVLTRQLIESDLSSQVITPNHALQNPWDGPFFYQDSRYVFYIATREQSVTIKQFQRYGDPPPFVVGRNASKIPPIVQQQGPRVPDRAASVAAGQPYRGIVDSVSMERFVTKDAVIKKGLGTIGTVRFGDKEIGPAGALVKQP
jgi:hypothetical protein